MTKPQVKNKPDDTQHAQALPGEEGFSKTTVKGVEALPQVHDSSLAE
jgi:hypothetical protein